MLVLSLVSVYAYGQGGGKTSSITGMVVDQPGGVIPGVTVRAKNTATSMGVNQIMNFPLATRNAVDLVVLLPGVNTAGITRDATFMGLGQEAVHITMDGVSAQENCNCARWASLLRTPGGCVRT